ncbi:MAG: hypothetical protein ACI8PP_000410 [Candidatus Pseudothioglobus sp.]|jgi:hypothetical protein|tara:strand:+ start:61 stop:561 length:501 start_codon:yes stop_codon:yes gene_type:complete
MSLYDVAVPTMKRTLVSLSEILKKAEAFAEERSIDPAVLVNARLAPDMFPLKRQIQIACDAARRGTGRLAEVEVAPIEDTEESFAELLARIATSIKFLDSLTPAQFEGAEAKTIILPVGGTEVTFDGTTFIMAYAMSNFSFHAVTAYNILRHNGVVLGKLDYLGTP